MSFIIKDSGKRSRTSTGMVRDSEEKIRYDLLPIPIIKRYAQHLTQGAKKYAPRNWEKASTPEELARFYASAWRHFIAWLEGEEDEDHAAALIFNISGAEHVKAKLGDDWLSKLKEFRDKEGDVK